MSGPTWRFWDCIRVRVWIAWRSWLFLQRVDMWLSENWFGMRVGVRGEDKPCMEIGL